MRNKANTEIRIINDQKFCTSVLECQSSEKLFWTKLLFLQTMFCFVISWVSCVEIIQQAAHPKRESKQLLADIARQ